jgi:hypothetical protein
MREVKKYRYFFAAILTIVIFVMGILFSNFVDQTRYDSLRTEVNQNNVELESQQLQLNYLRSESVQSCSALEAGLQEIVSGYNKRLGNLQSYRENSFFNKKEFETMKKSYILSGIRYWVFAQEIRQKCDYQADTVLFFTSQIGSANGCEECGKMGEQLSMLKKKYGDNLLIFTIPLEMEDGMVEMLEGQYNVTDVPAVVVNGNSSKKIEGFRSRKVVEEYLLVEVPN